MPTSVKKIAEHSYMLTDTVFRVNQFLLSGSDAALLIDTGYGKKHFFRALKKFSSPLVVANTHLHPDHSGGNFAFDEVFLGREDAPGNGIPTNELADSIAKYYRENSRFPNALINKVEKMMTLTPQSERYLPLPEKIQLRGREISVLSCPGHTPGSVIFSDEATRSLFVGDAINSAFWAFTNKTLKLKKYAETVSSLKIPAGIEKLWLSHQTKPLSPLFIEAFVETLSTVTPDDGKPIPIRGTSEEVKIYSKTFPEFGKIGIWAFPTQLE